MSGELERRMVPASLRVRDHAGQPKSIDGYGALYGVETVIAGLFREVIAPGAFTDTVKEDDIRVLFNHSPHYVLGRQQAKTAEIGDDRKGLRYVATLNPNDPDAQSIGAKIARRDVTGSSFSFTIANDDDETWTRDDPTKLPLRTIKRARVYDVGPVTFPAYEETSVDARTAAECREQAVRASVISRRVADELVKFEQSAVCRLCRRSIGDYLKSATRGLFVFHRVCAAYHDRKARERRAASSDAASLARLAKARKAIDRARREAV